MSVRDQQVRSLARASTIQRSVTALNKASERMARGLRPDAELVEAIAHLTVAVSALNTEPTHQRMDETVDGEVEDA